MALTIEQIQGLLNTLKPAVEAKKQARLAELAEQVEAEIANSPEAQQVAVLENELAELQNPQPEPQPEETQGTEELEQTQEQPEENQQ